MVSRLEKEILLAHVLGISRIDLITHPERTLTQKEQILFDRCIERLEDHEPIAYIVNNQPFMSLDFYVDRNVLIPRPETEKLVEVTIDVIKKSMVNGPWSIVDVGTGCGCIAISLAKYLPNVQVIGIDSSPEAIKVAKKNAEKHNVQNRCQFIVGNMLDPLPDKVDFVVSNPSYIPSAEIEKLDPNVKDYEPRLALDGGEDGLDYIRRLIKEGPHYLKETGYLIFEFGINQAGKIKELAKEDFVDIKIMRDDSGKERVFAGRKQAADHKE